MFSSSCLTNKQCCSTPVAAKCNAVRVKDNALAELVKHPPLHRNYQHHHSCSSSVYSGALEPSLYMTLCPRTQCTLQHSYERLDTPANFLLKQHGNPRTKDAVSSTPTTTISSGSHNSNSAFSFCLGSSALGASSSTRLISLQASHNI